MGVCSKDDGIGFAMKIRVIPGILEDKGENKREEVEKKISKIVGIVDEVSIDIIDGKFVDNKTIGVGDLENIDSQISLGVQLMVEEPIKMVEECAEVGVEKVIGHIELMKDQKEFVAKVKEFKMKVGLGLDLKTGVDFLEEDILDEIDDILLMSVAAGFSGQEFDGKVLGKIEKLRKEMGFKGNIWVDGGVNEKTIEKCVQMGANRLSITSGIWKEKDIEKQIGKLQRLAEKAVTG